jgi:hypothetical protein
MMIHDKVYLHEERDFKADGLAAVSALTEEKKDG